MTGPNPLTFVLWCYAAGVPVGALVGWWAIWSARRTLTSHDRADQKRHSGDK